MSSESAPAQLKPYQSADVIKWYHDAENAKPRSHGHRDKVPLGLSALHAVSNNSMHFPEGMSQRPLTEEEMSEGLCAIEKATAASKTAAAYMSQPPRTDVDRDLRERAAGLKLD